MLKPLDRAEVARYMGYRGHTPDGDILRAIDEAEGALFAVARPLSVWRCFAVTREKEGVSLAGTGVFLPGNAFARHTLGCGRAVLMAATLGAGADTLLRTARVKGAFDLLVADACATAAIEQVCDTLEEQLHEEMAGGIFTSRFSPGYGDLPLTIQDELLRLLDAQRQIGLTATRYSTLVPTKSVTALMGIKEGLLEGDPGAAARRIGV